ncbi:hypothetical protein [Bythopirellula polymerisocia]|uniref:Uncharacterized protein n=1 Tax=Bythopirellula polymerisocia TaxID=2528003 RepID=A0A5C6CXT5_9BACT|nr:hypothetical protein [Bythopirellula polymerisocia]TWU28281.1 hypothetical protein Pla144_15680 [Bythopirellula polymerisocia]
MCFNQVLIVTFAAILLQAQSARTATLENVSTEPSNPGAAIASDESPASSQDAVNVALELLRIQEELGGSIVSDFAEPAQGHAPVWNPPPVSSTPPARPHSSWVPRTLSPVEALRQTSWQLEQSAHLLESLDLYDQADAVRETAAVLRSDAREIKSQQK